MKIPKIKFCWNGSKVEADWHLGLFGSYTRGTPGSRLRGIVVTVRGLLAWLASLAVVAYFTGAAALWLWFDRRPYNYVTYADLVLPSRWEHIEKLRGRALIDEGMDDIKAQKWGEALAKLRPGIAKNPEEIKARITLAELFGAMKARKQAVAIYDGGLDFKYPGRDYIEAIIKSASQSEDHDWWIRTTDRALALVDKKPELEEERRWLIRQKLAGLVAADRTDEAIALAESEGELHSPTISELRVLALLKAGRPKDALTFLDEWSSRITDKADPQILRLQVRAFREAGDLDGMDRALERLREQAPADPRPYVYAIVQRLLANRRHDASATLDSFLLRFGSTPEYLQMLATPLAEIHELELTERLIEHATQQGFDRDPFRRFLAMALLGKGRWQEAGALIAQIDAKKNETLEAWQAIMQAQIQAALDPSPAVQSQLINLVRGRQFTLSFYKDLVGNLRKAGRQSTAREVITFAQGVYPQNPVFEGWRKELDDEIAATQAAAVAAAPVPRTIVLPKVDENSATAQREDWSETAFNARLVEFNKKGDHAGALREIREARRVKPIWLSSREQELARTEIVLHARSGDTLALRGAARLYITGDRMRSAQTIELARELYSAGRKDEAVLLLRELLAKVPDYAVAKNLLSEWSPKPPAAKP